ncbi:hypothetical protein [Solimonas flava]|uniref:hypothetical protein n=1 Tax=Solimonas flava TaxID=415849 RepID=UPI0004114B25|nr:hypothetical protein [Solimonas flava]
MPLKSAKADVTAHRVSERSTPEAPASVPAPKGSHVVVGELWRGAKRFRDGAPIDLTEAEALALGKHVRQAP